jgi:hypothetical protein
MRKDVVMPGNPVECRQHAVNCKRLAAEATAPQAKEYFIGLAAQWEHLAAELESAEIFLQTMKEIEPKDPHLSPCLSSRSPATS